MRGSENKWQWSTEQPQLFRSPQVELRRNTSECTSQQSSTWEEKGDWSTCYCFVQDVQIHRAAEQSWKGGKRAAGEEEKHSVNFRAVSHP